MSDPLDDLLAKQPLRAEDEENKSEHIGKPIFGGPADHWANGEFKKLLADANDQATDDRTRNGGEATKHQNGQGLQSNE